MIKVEPTSASTKKSYDDIASALAVRGAQASSMFGMPTLKAGGKAFAGIFGNAMVFKLGGDHHAEALALRGAKLFDPSGMGRPMKEWVVIPPAHAKRWAAFAEEALAKLGAAPAAKPKAKVKSAAPAKAMVAKKKKTARAKK